MRRAVKNATTALFPDGDELFAVPTPAPAVPAGLNYGVEVAHLVSSMLKGAEGDRYEIASAMSRLTGKDVSKLMLDGWSSEARDNFNMPFYLVPAFECATSSYDLTAWLAAKRGARVYVGRDALVAGLGQLQAQRDSLDGRIREMKRRLGGRA